MKGFDRPLKPSWIYEYIKAVNIGDKFSNHKDDLNMILSELEGRAGKRKVRTVLSRYFLKKKSNPRSREVEYTPIIELCKKYPLNKIKPLLLYFLLIRSQLLRELTKVIQNIYGFKKPINQTFLRKKIVEKYGDRDISTRSMNNFLNTLKFFGILDKSNNNKYVWKERMKVDEFNACYMLKFYAEEYKNSEKIILDNLESYLFFYFQMPNMIDLARKHNNILWEYSSRLGQRSLIINNTYKWKD